MHTIEQQVNAFIEHKKVDIDLLNALGKDFAAKLQADITNRFTVKTSEAFRLRMSNIGLSLRQLCLARDYGTVDKGVNFSLSGFYGCMLEALMVFLLKASGVNVQSTNRQVSLPFTLEDGTTFTLTGEYDLIIDNVLWDVKSASNFAYTHKFDTYETLASNDSFGYLAQGFCYAKAANVKFGGWIVINKEKGVFKVCPVPLLNSVQNKLSTKYITESHEKIKHIFAGKPAPACTGVVQEKFRGKPTGNKILNRDCEWCLYKDKCHKKIVKRTCLVSNAAEKAIKYYTHIDKKFQE